MAIEPSPDAYGNKARASAVADWLELLAWQGHETTVASGVDYFGDLSYSEGILLPEGDEDGSDEEDFTDRVRSVLARRAALLEGLYPFELTGERLVLRPDVTAAESPYLLLLSITIAHVKASAYQSDRDLVFAHPESGHPLDASALRNRHKAALKAAGLRKVRFHDLRHTFGTHCAAAGVPMRTLQEWMGHAQLQTTEIYADYAPSSHEKEMVERAFSGGQAEGTRTLLQPGDQS